MKSVDVMAGKVDELASGVGMVLMTEHPAPDEVAAAGTRVGVGDETALGVEVTAACCEEHEAKSSKAENARSKKKEGFKFMKNFPFAEDSMHREWGDGYSIHTQRSEMSPPRSGETPTCTCNTGASVGRVAPSHRKQEIFSIVPLLSSIRQMKSSTRCG